MCRFGKSRPGVHVRESYGDGLYTFGAKQLLRKLQRHPKRPAIELLRASVKNAADHDIGLLHHPIHVTGEQLQLVPAMYSLPLRESLTEHNGPRSPLRVATADVLKLRQA